MNGKPSRIVLLCRPKRWPHAGGYLGGYGEHKSISAWVSRAALPGSVRHPVSGRDPREGDDEDRDSSFGWDRFGPGWTPVAPTQARCGAAPAAGEDLETLSRALGVTAATLTGWQDSFLAAGEASLATRSTTGNELESERLKAKLGEMLLERELLEAKIAALEENRPLARRRSRP
jgi:transposase